MAEPITDRIVAQAVTQMKLISGSGSYVMTLGTSINETSGATEASVRDSETNWDEGELPAISVFDGDAVIQDPEAFDKSAIVLQTMRLLFRGYLKQGTTARAARRLNKDILTAIRSNPTFIVANVPLVMLTRQVRHAIVRNPNSFEVEACEVEIEVLIKNQKFNAEA
jgi:hypothetical protein